MSLPYHMKCTGVCLECGEALVDRGLNNNRRRHPHCAEIVRRRQAREWDRQKRRRDQVTRPLQCRVDPETRREVELYSRRRHQSIAQTLKDFITWGLENDPATQE